MPACSITARTCSTNTSAPCRRPGTTSPRPPSLIQEGERKAGRNDFWGYVWQGRAYEGLTTNALEWIASYGGGTIVDEKGEITINNPKAVEALKTAAGWVGTDHARKACSTTPKRKRAASSRPATPPSCATGPMPGRWRKGADSPIKDKVGIAPLPKGGADGAMPATLGGQLLAVSKYSKNPDAATDLVMYLTSADEQKRRAIEGSFNPTIVSLYSDAEIAEGEPLHRRSGRRLQQRGRPPRTVTGENYNKVSTEFFNAVHQVLSKRAEPDAGPRPPRP